MLRPKQTRAARRTVMSIFQTAVCLILAGHPLSSFAAESCFNIFERPKVSFEVPGGDPIELLTSGGVFGASQKYGFNLVEQALKVVNDSTSNVRDVLVIGSGSGYETVVLAKNTSPDTRIVATDIVQEAVSLTLDNASRHGVGDKVSTVVSDLFQNVRGRYDLILFNAPRAVTVADLVQSMFGQNSALTLKDLARLEAVVRPQLEKLRERPDLFDVNGELLVRLLDQVADHLTPNGVFLLMANAKKPLPLPPDLKARLLPGSVDLWSATSPEAGSFGVYAITLAPN